MDKRTRNRRIISRRKRRKQVIRRMTICMTAILIILILIVGIQNWKNSGMIEKKEIKRNIPLLFQYDSDWGEGQYGDSDIKTAGCAPTCIAMVVRGITKNKEITPKEVAKYAQKNGYYINGVGTQWSFMTEGSRKFKIKGKEISLDKSIVWEHLENGYPIICSVGPGDFTTEGHFIVLAGVQEGKLIVNDPNSEKRSNQLWNYEDIERQIKNLWVFKKE